MIGKCDFEVVDGSTIGTGTPVIKFTKLGVCNPDKKGLTLDDARQFASQCGLDELAGVELCAEDYNNWGCCLAWDDDFAGALDKVVTGLTPETKYRYPDKKETTKKALTRNRRLLEPELAKAVRAAEESGEVDRANELRKALGNE
jgi:hypothetical protein